MREKDGKYYAATGSKGYRWLESEMVKQSDKAQDIDRSYYDGMVDDAVDTVSQYGDFEWFVSDDTETLDEVPWFAPCGRKQCIDCPKFTHNANKGTVSCADGYDIASMFIDDVNDAFQKR